MFPNNLDNFEIATFQITGLNCITEMSVVLLIVVREAFRQGCALKNRYIQ